MYNLKIPFFKQGNRGRWDWDENLWKTYQRYQGSNYIQIPISINSFKTYLEKRYSYMYLFTVKPTKIIRYIPLGNYYINELNYKSLDLIIKEWYQAYNNPKEYWISTVKEVERINLYTSNY